MGTGCVAGVQCDCQLFAGCIGSHGGLSQVHRGCVAGQDSMTSQTGQ